MKKILSIVCAFFLLIGIGGCSSKSDEDILAFFEAFHNTLNAQSGHITAQIQMDSTDQSIIDIDLQMLQKEDLQIALSMDLESNGNRQEDFLQFYTRDGKTYLNSMGTTSQSVLSNLGIDASEKISVYDPFMNFSDSELCDLIESSSKDGNTYSLTIDPSLISTLLDSFGTVDVESSTLDAVIENETLSSFTLDVSGRQTLEEASENIRFKIDCQIEDLNKLQSIAFPEDLESY